MLISQLELAGHTMHKCHHGCAQSYREVSIKTGESGLEFWSDGWATCFGKKVGQNIVQADLYNK